MKKKFLLLCALMVSAVGTWGQNNLTLGKTVTPLGGKVPTSAYTEKSDQVTAVSDENLQYLTADNGNVAILLPQPTAKGESAANWTSTETASNQPIQSFYINLGSSQTVGKIYIEWETADVSAKNYKVYLTDTEPTGSAYDNYTLTGETEILSQTNFFAVTDTKTYTGGEQKSGQFIVFVAGKGANNVYGVKMKKFFVYDNEAPVLNSFTVSPIIIEANTATSLTLTALDKAGSVMEGVSYTVDDVATADFSAISLAEGAHTIKATAGAVVLTQTIHAITAPVAVPDGALTVYSNGSGNWGNYDWGWGGSGLSDLTIGGKVCRLGQGLGGMQVENNATFKSNPSNYGKLHVDVYSVAAHDLIVYFEGAGDDEDHRTPIRLSAGWNNFDVKLGTFTNLEDCTYLTFRYDNTTKDGVLLFANVYYTVAVEDNNITGLTASKTIIVKGEAVDLGLVATNTDGLTIANSNVTYTSEDGTFDEVTGYFTANTIGDVTITGTTGSGATEQTATTTVKVIAAVPTTPDASDAANVQNVFCDTYTAPATLNVATGYQGGCTSAEQVEYTTGNNLYYAKGTKAIGFSIESGDTRHDFSAYNKVHVAIYAFEDIDDAAIWLDGNASGNDSYANGLPTPLKANQWNEFTLPLSGTLSNVNYLFVQIAANEVGTVGKDVLIDNIYYGKVAADEIIITPANAKGIAAVTGTITTSNKNQVEAITSKVINISKATLDEGVTSISLANNQLLLVNSTSDATANDAGNIVSTQAPTLTGNTTNVIVTDGTYYWSAKQLSYVDDNEHQPNTAFSINVKTGGYQIQRTIGAGKYVTTYLPVAVTEVPIGLTVYALDGTSTSTEVKFTKKDILAANTPLVLHNSTAFDITLTATQAAPVEGTINLNLTETPATVQNDAATISFIGNYAAKAGDGSTMYGLSGSTDEVPAFKKIGTGATIGAFRAYFTGLSTSGARATFVDGDVTKVGTINAAGEITMGEVYNLNGQRVANPTKGLYIVNGRKVIIK